MAAPWSFAVPDWRERIEAGKSLMPSLPVDRVEYDRATKIFDKLRLPDVIGKPALAEAGGEWFREIVGTVLGSVEKKSGVRKVPELFLLAPKKSSKTSYGAAFMVTALIMNERPRAEFLLVAPSRAIAELAFSQALGMVEADDFLRQRMHPTPHMRLITDRITKATLGVKSFDSKILTGVKPAGVLLDELHEIAKNAAARRVIGQIRGGMIAAPESFLAMITTQSDMPPRGAFEAELKNARGIRDGRTPGRTLSILYEFPERIANDKALPPAWKDSRNWWMVTPNLGRPFGLTDLEEGLARAERDGQGEVIRWASQHLNIEIGLALGSDRWAGADHWQDCADESITLESIIEHCDVIVIGLDGGGLDDLLGMAVLGRNAVSGKYMLWNRAWAHEMALERRKSEESRMRNFQEDGDLIVVDRMEKAFAEMARLCEQVDESGKLTAVAVDPYGVKHIEDALDNVGIGEDRRMGVPQGWKLSGAIKDVEVALSDGMMEHAGQRLMAWCVSNAKVEAKGNAVAITKQAAGVAKIDPLVATFIAQARMSATPPPAAYQMIFLDAGARR
jgi:phage terminase large subunit-like protein